MTITYEIYLRAFETNNGKSWGGYKTVLMMKKTFQKPISKQSKVLPLMVEFSKSGKRESQLIRYKIQAIGESEKWHFDYKTREIIYDKPQPTILVTMMPTQNDDYMCYNCINYQHKRCKRLLMQEMSNQAPCNCKKCWK